MNNDLIYNITIFAGTDYVCDMSYTNDAEEPVDLTGWTVEATLREFPEATDGIDFLTTADAEGVHLALTASQTRDIGFSLGVYDIFVVSPDHNLRVKLIRGRAEIYAQGTRWE